MDFQKLAPQLQRLAPPKDLSTPYGQLYGTVVSWCAWEAIYIALYVPLVSRLILPRKGAAADRSSAASRLWRIKLVNALHGALVGPIGIYALYMSDEFTKDATTAVRPPGAHPRGRASPSRILERTRRASLRSSNSTERG